MGVNTKVASKAEVRKLEAIIAKLERWQNRNSQHDQNGLARDAKDKLLRLLRELERQ